MRRLTIRLPKPVSGSLARQVRLLLALSAALAGFFLLLNFLVSLVSSGPHNILAVNPAPEDYIRLPNGVVLLEIAVFAVSAILALAVLIVSLGLPLRRTSIRPSRSLAFGVLVAVALVGTGAYLAFSGILGEAISYDEHSVRRSLLRSSGLAVLASFFLSVTIAALINRKVLALLLMVWLVVAIALGFLDTKPLTGLQLFESTLRLEKPVAYTALVEGHLRAGDALAEETEATFAASDGTKPSGQSGAVAHPADSIGPLVTGVTAMQVHRPAHEPAFRVSGAAHTRFLRTATGDVYRNGEWSQLDSMRLPVAPGAVVSDALAVLIEELLTYQVTSVLPASPTVTPTSVEVDRIAISPADGSSSFEAGAVPISKSLESINVAATYYPFSATLSLPGTVSSYEWRASAPLFALPDLLEAAPATDPTYLQLPDGLPERIYQMAEQLGDSQSPYLKANLIKKYLEREYTYRFAEPGAEAEQPPAGQDPIDWFLFDHRVGSSGTFSSAFVVLARAAGIPARVVSGWAIEERLEEQTVHLDQAHQWAEIALDGMGWITFDLTPGDPLEPKEGDYTLETALEELTTSSDPEVRAEAAEALGELGEPGALPILVEAMVNDQSLAVQLASLTALQTFGVDQLIWILLNHDDPLMRVAAANALRALEDLRALDALFQALASDEDAQVRVAVANALAEIGKGRAEEPLLLAATSDEDSAVRVAAVRALGALKTEWTAHQLVAVLRSDPDNEVREAVAWALGQIKAGVALRPLLHVRSGDEAAAVRLAASEALMRWGLFDLASILREAQDPTQRAAAAEILGERGDYRAIPALSNALSDPDKEVRKAAIDALQSIGAISWLENGAGLLTHGGDDTALIPGTTAVRAADTSRTPVFEVTGAAHTNLLRTAVGDVYVDGLWLPEEPIRLSHNNPAEAVRHADILPSGSAATLHRDQISISHAMPDRPTLAGLVPTAAHLETISIPGTFWPRSATFAISTASYGYTWTSQVHDYSEGELNGAERWTPPYAYPYTDLPDWAWLRRVQDLATEITAGHSTPYAEAKAIEQYLQTEYTYRFADSVEEALPPPGRDPVDWFLFERREGTSGNFSSAFVALARSVGIPARVVSGWTIRATPDRQTVYSDQAHQWAEVAFGDLGWIVFDPTPGGAPSRTAAESLSGDDPEAREKALAALEAAGAEVTRLENGGALVVQGGYSRWISGTTTQQAAEPPHIPVFNVSGASNTGYLRTSVGDVYAGDYWVQLDPVTIPYTAHDSVFDTLWGHYSSQSGQFASLPSYRQVTESQFASLPSYRQVTESLFGFRGSSADHLYVDWIDITPGGAFTELPGGLAPTPLYLERAAQDGEIYPFSSTFSTEHSMASHSWTAVTPSYSAAQYAAAVATTDSTYTQLPVGLPERILDLALSITSGHATTYAKAKALERYLQTNYTYRLADGSGKGDPPPGRDPMDWFLFDHREGTCGVFSSAFVVLARSVGIPARVVSGWAIRATPDRQTVYSDQAHQWAEVAFEGLGWITFEPTAGGAPSRADGGGDTQLEPTGPLDTVTTITQWPAEVRRRTPFVVGGTVNTAAGLPVSGMQIEIYVNETKEHGGAKVGTTVTRLGSFQAEVKIPADLELGDYQLLARAVGNDQFEESWSDPDIRVFSGNGFEMSGPAEVPVDVEAVFKGRLWEDTGRGVADRELAVTIDGSAASPVITDPSGNFTFSRTFSELGPHWIEVELKGQDFLLDNIARLDFQVTLPTETALDAPVFVEVGEEFRIAGALRSVRGDSVAGEYLYVQIGDGPEQSVLTDSSGLFEFTGSVYDAGEFTVRAEFQGNGPVLSSMGTARLAARHAVVLTLDGPRRIDQGDGATFMGRLASDTFSPTGQLELTLGDVRGSHLTTVTTDEDGRFEYHHPSFDSTGPHSLTARFSGGEFVAPSSAGIAFSVLAPALLTIDGPTVVREGELFELTGTLLQSNGQPVPDASIQVSGGDSLSLVTDADGKFIWEALAALDQSSANAPLESELTFEVAFAGTDHLVSTRATWDVPIAIPGIVVEPPEPVARGDAVALRGWVLVGSRPMSGVELAIGPEGSIQSNEVGAFTHRYLVANNTPLGTSEVVVSATGFGVSVKVPIEVKSASNLIITPVDEVRPGGLAMLQATLLDDAGSGIPQATLRSSQGVEAVTDDLGVALLELTAPESGELPAVPVTFTFDGDDLNMPLSVSYLLGGPVTSAGFNWFLWVGIPGLIAVAVAAAYAGRKVRVAPVPDLIRWRPFTNAPPRESPAAPDEDDLAEGETVDGPQPAQLEVWFVKAAQELPDVWGTDEEVLIKVGLTDIEGQAIGGASVGVSVSGGEAASQLSTDNEGVCTLSWTGNEPGEYLVSAEFAGDDGHLPSSISRRFRKVDFREEIVRLYNTFLDWAADRTASINEQSTPREVELILVSEGLSMSQKSLDELISRFEEADYSEHPIARRHYEAMYHAWRTIVEA